MADVDLVLVRGEDLGADPVLGLVVDQGGVPVLVPDAGRGVDLVVVLDAVPVSGQVLVPGVAQVEDPVGVPELRGAWQIRGRVLIQLILSRPGRALPL